MSYKAVLVGINEEGYYLNNLGNVKAGDLKNIVLKPVSEKTLDAHLNGLDATRVDTPAFGAAEIGWLRAEKTDVKVQRLLMEQAKFREMLLPIVFPCEGSEFDPAEDIEM